jgi:hypothetical protein
VLWLHNLVLFHIIGAELGVLTGEFKRLYDSRVRDPRVSVDGNWKRKAGGSC